jgi:adenosylcobinamide-GDP ribazoletransferase
MIKKALIAMQFLTIIPVRVRGDISERALSGSTIFFPVVGALQGLVCVSSAALLSRLFAPEITGCLIIVILIIINGGFHLDGLADTFDAMAVKSAGDEDADREKRLSVMKDSVTGAIGVIAIVIAVLLKYLLLKNIFLYSSSITLYSLLFLMPVFSKWIMVPAMYLGTSARKDGLGRVFIDAVTRKDVALSAIITVFFSLFIVEMLQYTAYASSAVSLFLFLFPVLCSFCFAALRFAKKRFGGLTGDTFGAISEISDILFLLVASIWLQHSI